MKSILWLDCDFIDHLQRLELAYGQELLVIPELPYELPIGKDRLPDAIRVDNAAALNPMPAKGRMSVYEPSLGLLQKITRVTAEQRLDWVIVGNNLGAGLMKAESVTPRLRGRIIIAANDHPDESDYHLLGCRYFTSRRNLPMLLMWALREFR